MSTLNILYQSSSAYAIPAAVSICSLYENNKDIEDLRVFYIDDGLTEEDRKQLDLLAERYGRKITFINPEKTKQFLAEKNIEMWSGSYATYYKLFICNELMDIDRIAYIDSDTVVAGSLKGLISLDLEGYACGMVASAMCPEIKRFLHVKNYYNAGFELYNLDYWRKNNVGDHIIDCVLNEKTRYKYTIVADESLINASINKKIKKVPLKYDCEATWWLWGSNKSVRKKLGWGDNDGDYSLAEIKKTYKHPTIIHFMDLTTGRPWDYLNDHPFRSEYYKYLEILKPWKEVSFNNRGLGGKSKFLLRMKWLVKKIMPFKLRGILGYNQHRNAWIRSIEKVKNK